MKQIELSLFVFGALRRTARDLTLCNLVSDFLDRFGDSEFEYINRGNSHALATTSNLLNILMSSNVLIRVTKGSGGRGVSSPSIYKFDEDFYKCVTDKDFLLAKIEDLL